MNMNTFKMVLKKEMSRKARSREEYETIIATWSLKGWLTEAETEELLAYLDEVYPVEDEPEEVEEE